MFSIKYSETGNKTYRNIKICVRSSTITFLYIKGLGKSFWKISWSFRHVKGRGKCIYYKRWWSNHTKIYIRGIGYLYLITYAGKGGAAFIVGILKAIFNSAGFPTSKIEYYTNSDDIDDNNTKSLYPSTLFFIVFKQEAIKWTMWINNILFDDINKKIDFNIYIQLFLISEYGFININKITNNIAISSKVRLLKSVRSK